MKFIGIALIVVGVLALVASTIGFLKVNKRLKG